MSSDPARVEFGEVRPTEEQSDDMNGTLNPSGTYRPWGLHL